MSSGSGIFDGLLASNVPWGGYQGTKGIPGGEKTNAERFWDGVREIEEEQREQEKLDRLHAESIKQLGGLR